MCRDGRLFNSLLGMTPRHCIAFSGTVLGMTGMTRRLTWFDDLGCGSPVLDEPVDDYLETAPSGLYLMLFRVE